MHNMICIYPSTPPFDTTRIPYYQTETIGNAFDWTQSVLGPRSRHGDDLVFVHLLVRFSFYVPLPFGSGVWIDPLLDNYA